MTTRTGVIYVAKYYSHVTSAPNILFIFVSFAEYYKILEIPVIFADFLRTKANLS